ncbi:50S ribosomal protein L23 [Halarsenatibacter silvermanii]|uniref:Large ribosomal subunit protein uL23 n=1 Tax=Halarsenatibacter silvermanii TaxID=321763 RepID=A0A1G9N9L3_9FIRM|nr:50S ribosomal protein L23 [Halarsenatibacter silvermanii]SDL83134.1 LSU ribosomal protein L23P [Halarsenatibacter silvermanii]
MDDLRDVVIAPIVTEKSMQQMEENNVYTFQVDPGANKIEIRQAIEEAFNVKVENVNTMNYRGKTRRLGYNEGKRPDWKKAVVKLSDGDSIELFEGV